MLGDEKIATFQTQTDDTPRTSDDDKLIYHISDYLNSSSLDLSSTGVLMQAVDYLPFGEKNVYEVSSTRVKGKKGGYKNKYLFANKQEDTESDLQYFEKRYYDNRIGRFTTTDPVYWEVGITARSNPYFTDPQQWNSYSYVRNNPINMVDPTGETVALAGRAIGIGVTIMCNEECRSTAAVLLVALTVGYIKMMEKLGSDAYNATHSNSNEQGSSQSSSNSQSQAGTASPPPSGGNNGKKDDKDTSGKSWQDKDTILKDSKQFDKTNKSFGNSNIYRDKSTGNYLYRDPAGKNPSLNHNHLEVFNKRGQHIGTANPSTGKINPNSAVKGRSISNILK